MANQFLSELNGKPVLSARGQDVGTQRTVTMNPRTGKLEELIIDPAETHVTSSKLSKTPAGYYSCPPYLLDRVDSVIVVDIS